MDRDLRTHFEGRWAELVLLEAAVNDATSKFVTLTVTEVVEAMEVLEVQLLDARRTVEGGSTNALNALRVINDTAEEYYQYLHFFQAYVDENEQLRQPGVTLLFVVILAVGALGLLGVVSGLVGKKACMLCVNMLYITCLGASMATWLAFVISGLAIMGSVLWSDGCNFVGIVSKEWGMLLDEKSAAVLNGCFRGVTVVDSLNTSKPLSFAQHYKSAVEELGNMNISLKSAEVETEILALRDFVYSLNATSIAVSELNYFTDSTLNGSLSEDVDCSYNVSFSEGSVTQPWEAAPLRQVVTEDGNTTTVVNVTQSWTPWVAGGGQQNFSRQSGESAGSYMSRVFNKSDCSLNADLFSTWDRARQADKIRAQIVEDLTCVVDGTVSGGGDYFFCGSSNSSLSSSSSFTFASSNSSECACTSSNYTEDGSALGFLREFTGNLTQLVEGLQNLTSGGSHVGTALANAETAQCMSKCSFLRSQFNSFESIMCGIATSLSVYGVSLFLLGLAGTFIMISAAIMSVRLKSPWAKNMAKVISAEDGIDMD